MQQIHQLIVQYIPPILHPQIVRLLYLVIVGKLQYIQIILLTSLPRSASLQNIKVLNKQNLVLTIRSNKGDIATNIVLEDSTTKMPYESYRNSNSSSSLKNSHKLQSQNITKTEQYSNTSSFSSQTSNVSNVSNLLAENANSSHSNVNRSATNTPSTSISDDHNRLSNEIRNSSGSSCDE